jgi:hypothetical protein
MSAEPTPESGRDLGEDNDEANDDEGGVGGSCTDGSKTLVSSAGAVDGLNDLRVGLFVCVQGDGGMWGAGGCEAMAEWSRDVPFRAREGRRGIVGLFCQGWYTPPAMLCAHN